MNKLQQKDAGKETSKFGPTISKKTDLKKDETTKTVAAEKEPAKVETSKLESGKLESGKLESGKPEAGKLVSGNVDQGKFAPSKFEKRKLEEGKVEQVKMEVNKVAQGKEDTSKPDLTKGVKSINGPNKSEPAKLGGKSAETNKIEKNAAEPNKVSSKAPESKPSGNNSIDLNKSAKSVQEPTQTKSEKEATEKTNSIKDTQQTNKFAKSVTESNKSEITQPKSNVSSVEQVKSEDTKSATVVLPGVEDVTAATQVLPGVVTGPSSVVPADTSEIVLHPTMPPSKHLSTSQQGEVGGKTEVEIVTDGKIKPEAKPAIILKTESEDENAAARETTPITDEAVSGISTIQESQSLEGSVDTNSHKENVNVDVSHVDKQETVTGFKDVSSEVKIETIPEVPLETSPTITLDAGSQELSKAAPLGTVNKSTTNHPNTHNPDPIPAVVVNANTTLHVKPEIIPKVSENEENKPTVQSASEIKPDLNSTQPEVKGISSPPTPRVTAQVPVNVQDVVHNGPTVDANLLYERLPEEFFKTIFYFSGMGSVIGSALSEGVHVDERHRCRAIDSELLPSRVKEELRRNEFPLVVCLLPFFILYLNYLTLIYR